MDVQSDYKLLVDGNRVLLDVVVERPAWIAGPAKLPVGWLRTMVRAALRNYFVPRPALVFMV